MVCPGQRAPTTSRTVGVNEKPTQWTWSIGQNCTSLGKTTMLGQPCERAVRIRMGLPLAPPNSTCKVYLKKSIKTLRERDLGVGGPRAWLCKSCSKHKAQTHPWRTAETESKRNSSSASTNRKKDCVQMSEPRPPPKISLRHDWTKELSSEVARQPEGEVARQPEGEVARHAKVLPTNPTNSQSNS